MSLQPIQSNTPIADASGRPTQSFLFFINQLLNFLSTSTSTLAQQAFDLATTLLHRNINTTGGLQGGGDLETDLTLSLTDTGVTPGTYGDGTHVGQFTVDSKGRLTSATNVAVSGGGGGAIFTQKQSLNGLSTFTFTVPAGYSTLRLIIYGATLAGALQDNPSIIVNGVTGAVYSTQRSYAFSGTTSADQELNATSWKNNIGGLPGTTAPANTSGFIDVELYDYSNTVFQKTGRFHSRQPFDTGSPFAATMSGVLEVNETSAVTSITVSTGSGSLFTNGSSIELLLLP